MAEKKDIQEKVLWVIQSSENQKGGGTDLRVIQWVIDGKPGRPMLEKRDWYNTAEGDRKAGKAKGMGAGDLYLIIKNIKQIARLLEVKPAHLDEAWQLAMMQDDKPATASAQKPESASSIAPKKENRSSPEDAFRQAEKIAAGAAPDVKF